MQKNNIYRLCGDRDKTINHVISECRKLRQKQYKTRYDWMERVIHWELCKKLKFNQTIKWYMHKPESILKMRGTKFSGILTYKQITCFPTRRSDLVIVNKKNEKLLNREFCHLRRPQSENKRKQKDIKVLRPCQRTKKNYRTWRWWWYCHMLCLWEGRSEI